MATQPPLQGKEIGWPPPSICKYPPDAAHEWVADVDNEIVVEVKGRPYVLTPLIKRYLDPYGLTTKVPRTPLEDPGGCPLCHSLFVSHSNISLSLRTNSWYQPPHVLTVTFISLAVRRRIPVPGPSAVVQKEEKVAIPLKKIINSIKTLRACG